MSKTAQFVLHSTIVFVPILALLFAPSHVRPAVFELLMATFFCYSGVTVILDHRRTAKMHRAQAGLCPECGYDMRANSEHCSECGTVIVRTKQAIDSPWDIAVLARRYVTLSSGPAIPPRKYLPTLLKQIPEMDTVFLEAQTSNLAALGILPNGEFMTQGRLFDAFRSFLSEDQTVVASVGCGFHIAIGSMREVLKVVYLRSELSDGTFVITERIICQPSHQIARPPHPAIDIEIHWDPCDACQLLHSHRRRIAEKMNATPGLNLIPCADIAAIFTSQRRLEELRYNHNVSTIPDENTIRASFARRPKEWQDALIAEVHRLQKMPRREISVEDQFA